MDNRKWLKRKYPKTFIKVNEFLNDSELEKFKNGRYKLGRVIISTCDIGLYPKGTLLMFKRRNPINDENYPMHHGIVKCRSGFTSSGYLSINIWDDEFKEVYN